MGFFKSDHQEKEIIHGITKVVQFTISPRHILDYYLSRMSLFSEKDMDLINARWSGEILKDKDGMPITDTEIQVDNSIAVETHSAGFKKVIESMWLYDKESNKRTHNERQNYIFPGQPNSRWQRIWKFELKYFLSGEEYRRIVGKGYQECESEEQCEPDQQYDHGGYFSHGEELTLRLDTESDTMCLFGNYGRFSAFRSNFYDDYKIPEENVILRIHPGVNEYEHQEDEYDALSGARYRAAENGREWLSKGGIFWMIYLFDTNGIQKRDNLIKEPPKTDKRMWKEK